jgi:hypothetical protein
MMTTSTGAAAVGLAELVVETVTKAPGKFNEWRYKSAEH